MKSMAPEAGIRILERLARSDDAQTVVWPPDWQQWAELYPTFARTSFVSHLLGPSAAPAPATRSTIRSLVSDLPEAQRPSAVHGHVAREIAARIRIRVEDLPLDLPLERLGFDSLQATELQARLRSELGVRIPVLRLLGFSTVRTIAEEVIEGLRQATPTGTATS
jgi:acyl carrier protein